MNVLKVNLGIDVAMDNCACNLSVLTAELSVKVIASRMFLNTEHGLGELVKEIMCVRKRYQPNAPNFVIPDKRKHGK